MGYTLNFTLATLFPPVILLPTNGLNQAVHGLTKRDMDTFTMRSELIAPRGQQQQQAGGTVVHVVGRRMINFRESIVFYKAT